MQLLERYQKEIAPKLQAELGYKSALAVPKIMKVTINVGVGRMSKDKAYLDAVVEDVRDMSGQKPVLVKAKKSISAFKVRQGDIVGVVAVLRGHRMYDFVEKLVGATLPRIRDFRGLDPKIVDTHGSMSIGFRDHTAFPEIKIDEVERVHGLEVVITTNAKKHEAGLALFKLIGFPFKKDS